MPCASLQYSCITTKASHINKQLTSEAWFKLQVPPRLEATEGLAVASTPGQDVCTSDAEVSSTTHCYMYICLEFCTYLLQMIVMMQTPLAV